ncbi:MAG: TolC family protein [Deltaproteobacteria bacterium]|nr:TolC family protein [Deltaproteobacteria bacterium]
MSFRLARVLPWIAGLVSCIGFAALVHAQTAGGTASARRGARTRVVTLEEALRVAERGSPTVRAAELRVEAARARLGEAWSAPFSELTATGGVAIAPEVRGTTLFSPDSELPLDNPWMPIVRGSVQYTLPLWTWGRIGAARDAARAGVRASRAQARRARTRLRFDVARAYFGLQFSRDTLALLAEGRGPLRRAIERLEQQQAERAADFDPIDLYRIRAAWAEVVGRNAEARHLERSSLAALRLLTGDPRIEVPDELSEPCRISLRPLSWYLQAARLHRPEVAALGALRAAKTAARDVERSRFLPDVGLVLTAGRSYGPGVTDQRNPFVSDPANSSSLGAALGLQWRLDVVPQYFRYRQASLELEATALDIEQALGGIGLEVRDVYETVQDARDREAAWGEAETATRSWFVAASQSFAVGTAEAKDLVDAVRAYFTSRASHLAAIRDLNIAAAQLSLAVGTEVVPASRCRATAVQTTASPPDDEPIEDIPLPPEEEGDAEATPPADAGPAGAPAATPAPPP